jgi:hypothetical protein
MATPIQPPPLEIRNATSSVLEIQVEILPERYLLKPGDKMAIEADPDGVPFTVVVYDGSLQIYPGNTYSAVVTINGAQAEPDWDTKV